MNLRQATKELQRPLVFGDANQIKARDFFDYAGELMQNCAECDNRPHCNEAGFCPEICDCIGLRAIFHEGEVSAAIALMRNRFPIETWLKKHTAVRFAA